MLYPGDSVTEGEEMGKEEYTGCGIVNVVILKISRNEAKDR